MMERVVSFSNGIKVPAIGLGTWKMGDDISKENSEIAALQTGISLNMSLIDTAEMYASGKAEEIVGKAIKSFNRESLFIVSKVLPQNAGCRNIFKSLEKTLINLQTTYLDLYLLHWKSSVPLNETVECMEKLVSQKKIRMWGVSNFDTEDMKQLWKIPNGNHCATNQVLYHVGSRGIEFDLLPWMRKNNVPLMAYCPLAQAGRLNKKIFNSPVIKSVAEKHDATVNQVLLSFLMQGGDVITIPKSGNPEHVKENAGAFKLVLTNEDIHEIDNAFPAPTTKVPLEIE